MGKKIFFGCYEVPGWGGASTISYLLFARMQREGFDVAYTNLVAKEDGAFFRRLYGSDFGNPQGLDNVATSVLEEPLWGSQAALAELIERSSPDLLFGNSSISAWLLKLAAPHRPVVFMTSGSPQVQQLIETGAVKDFMAFKRSVERGIVFPLYDTHPEVPATELSDLIVVHSPHVRFAFEHFFPGNVGKIYSNTISVADLVYMEAERFKSFRRSSSDRDIDVIFVASKWNRSEKNYPLVRKIISRCRGLNVHVVGEVDHPDPSAKCHGAIARRDDLYRLLGRSKTLVSPSLMDAAPGVLFEASGMDCNVVASPNCGNWQLCNERLLAEECSLEAFLPKIHLAVSRPFEDNREYFVGGYEDLVETLSVF